MAKPQAPRWLTQSFADGVVEQMPPRPAPAYKGALGRCWLAQLDDRRRPCSGRLERAHLIRRQRVEQALWALLPGWGLERIHWAPHIASEDFKAWRDGLIQLAAWDPRNGVIACEGHHRRFDSHLTPALTVPYDSLPEQLIEFASEWGIEGQLERFPSKI